MIITFLFLFPAVLSTTISKDFGLLLQGLDRGVREDSSGKVIDVLIDLDQDRLSPNAADELIDDILTRYQAFRKRLSLTKNPTKVKTNILARAKQITEALETLRSLWHKLVESAVDGDHPFKPENKSCSVQTRPLILYDIFKNIGDLLFSNEQDLKSVEEKLRGGRESMPKL